MNRGSLNLKTGWVTYGSRSRNPLWIKGESRGHMQRVIELRTDCDGDTSLCLVDQGMPAPQMHLCNSPWTELSSQTVRRYSGLDRSFHTWR
ncbi:phosphoribosyl-AMP cyclohydrolase [Marinobacterium lutimaris]